MAQIEEKERKKRLALEEKEQRKAKREEKRRQKEVEQKRKVEERQKKRSSKVDEVTKKHSRRVSEKTAPRRDEVAENLDNTIEPPRKKPRKEQNNVGADAEIDTNVCCVCFGLYTDDVSGADWIECGCGRWLHEECAEECVGECVVDVNGKERFCPTCL